MVVVVVMAYYGSIATVRMGIDPDTYGIPIVSSTVDLIGALALVAVIAAFGFA
jgi:mgtE-like transporter